MNHVATGCHLVPLKNRLYKILASFELCCRRSDYHEINKHLTDILVAIDFSFRTENLFSEFNYSASNVAWCGHSNSWSFLYVPLKFIKRNTHLLVEATSQFHSSACLCWSANSVGDGPFWWTARRDFLWSMSVAVHCCCESSSVGLMSWRWCLVVTEMRNGKWLWLDRNYYSWLQQC